MKKTFKCLISFALVFTILFCALPLCVSAEDSDYFTYTLIDNGKEYGISKCSYTGSGSLYISPINITGEETIIVPVHIYQNPGLMGFAIKLEYDKSIFTPVCVTGGELIQSGLLNDSIESALAKNKNNFRVIWTGDEEITEDGILFYVEFQVNETSEERSTITLSYTQDDTFNENFEEVELTCSSGIVTFDSNNGPTFYANPINTVSGSDVTIPIYVTNPCGLTGFDLDISFLSSQMTFVGVEGNVNATVSGSTVHVTKNDSTVILGDSLMFSITFAVNGEASGEAVLGVSVTDCEFNGSGNANAEDISVMITQPIVATNPEIYSTEITAQPNRTISVPVYIRNNNGIMGFTINLDYDSSVLTLNSVERGTVLSRGLFDTNLSVAQTGECKIVWNSTEDFCENGILFTLEFSVLPDIAVEETEISMTYSQDDTYNESWEDVELEIDTPFATVNINEDSPTGSFTFTNGAEAVESGSIKYVYGLKAQLTSEQLFNNYTESENVTVNVNYAFGTAFLGTKSEIEVRNVNNEIIDSYTVVIFGDVNGDGFYDGMDSVIVSCIANGMLTREQAGEAVWLAADCNHDGEVEAADVEILKQAGLILAEIQQSDNQLETVSLQEEYDSLICQTVSEKITEEPTEPAEEPISEKSVFKMIVDFILKIFSLLFFIKF